MTDFEMCIASLQRPANYAELPPERQWDIDKSLRILDWDGINLDKARECVEVGDTPGSAEFKMNLPELAQVVRAFDARSG